MPVFDFPLLLDIPRRGHRDYLKGGDIALAIFNHLGIEKGDRIKEFKIGYLRFLRNQALLNISHSSDHPKNASAVFSYKPVQGNELFGWLEEAQEPIQGTVPCTEEEVSRSVEIIENQAKLTVREPRWEVLEATVVVTKYLHCQLYPLNAGRWVLAALNLIDRIPSDHFRTIEITLNSDRGEFTRSEIQIDGNRSGHILFAAIERSNSCSSR